MIFDAPQSIHEAAGVDLDGDGDVDILAKNWNDGAFYYLENQQVPNPAGVRSAEGFRPRKGAGG